MPKKNDSVGRLFVFLVCTILQGQRSGIQTLSSPFTSPYRLCRRRYLDINVQPFTALALAQHGLPCIRHIALHRKTKADEVRSGSHESFKKKPHRQSPLEAEWQRHHCRGGRRHAPPSLTILGTWNQDSGTFAIKSLPTPSTDAQMQLLTHSHCSDCNKWKGKLVKDHLKEPDLSHHGGCHLTD